MIDKSFAEKLKSEKPLDWKEVAQLDRLLEQGERSREIMSAMPDSDLSLTWRSQLNEKLLNVTKRRRRFAIVPWLGGFATAAACLVVFVVVSTKAPTATSIGASHSIEAELVSTHKQDRNAQDLADELPDFGSDESAAEL